MPSDDLVLNVRQVAGYSPTANAPPSSALLIQLGGLGGPYASISPQDLVSTALATGGDMAIAGALAVQSVSGGSAQFSNAAINMFSAQKACIVDFAATWGTVAGVQIATVNDVSALDAALRASTVWTFNGRRGDVRLWIDDIICAGGAPIFSPRFQGSPRACTPPPTSNSSRLATTAFVANALGIAFDQFAPLDSPAFTGLPTAPTAALGSADGQLATTAFVMNAVTESTTGVSSFNARAGAVVLNTADISAAGGALLASPAFTGIPTAATAPPGTNTTQLATTAFVMAGAGWAPLASPAFTGVPTAPTPTPGTSTTQLATTAFVQSAIASVSAGVVTFNGRVGAVQLIANDISAAGGALLASPAFTGIPTAATAPPGTNTTQLATCAFVMALTGFAPLNSPAFTGVPTAPTATLGTNTTQLATTAFVAAAISGSTAGVVSFNSRTGAVTLQANDISAAGGAPLASPAFTGTPSAPTAALGASTTQLATTAFVMNAASTTPPLMDGTAAAGNGTTWARNNHVHPSDTSRAAATALANYALLAGASFTGAISAPSVSATGQVGGTSFSSVGNISAGGVISTQDNFSCQNTNGQTALGMTGPSTATWQNVGIPSNVQLDNGGNFVFNGPGSAVKPGGGPWVAPSDDRIKTELGEYTPGLDDVLRLRPIVFEYKGNDGDPASRPANPTAKLAAEHRRFTGFIAQELEQIFPAMVTSQPGYIDGEKVGDFRYVNVGDLTYALVNAVKTLAARVAALEAA